MSLSYNNRRKARRRALFKANPEMARTHREIREGKLPRYMLKWAPAKRIWTYMTGLRRRDRKLMLTSTWRFIFANHYGNKTPG